ncbi:CBLinteracting protein kinase, putative [Acanthamoeba castellanii str. Neff]|uniref:non-specific serine/threonine protein kinase n=1 Tax=Acanthamoeba castellanii (strain ATCC 30010 / Neff) TaxID=1257118 RepID=L8GXF8_ACACF|nr:CBLinteracting protein kinase, putative [Acanthamoeba castellanii str. Neff]ELR17258.1 CBLinteracting protein kinase, putative [Acanthamoeba castellanii str. Neff]
MEQESTKRQSTGAVTATATGGGRIVGERYQLGRLLGEGEYSKPVAVKILPLAAAELRHDAKREVLRSEERLYMVMELVAGGEVYFKLAHEGRFDENTARRYFQQLMAGVEYCHAVGVCHRDLKPENLLLSDQGLLKISDFGFSTFFRERDRSKVLHTACGTPNYVAPEVLAKRGYEGTAADVWSCGCILYTFVAGHLAFEDSNPDVLFRKIKAADYTIPSHVPAGARDLIGRILVPDPAKRITMAQIKQHPWLAINPYHAEPVEQEPWDLADLDDELEVVTETTSASGRTGLQTANAFELIGMMGTLNLSGLLQRDSDTSTKRARQLASQTKFISTEPPDAILDQLKRALAKQTHLYAKVDKDAYKLKVAGRCATGPLTFRAQIFRLASHLHLVDFTKGRGDVLEYYRIYNAVLDTLHGTTTATAPQHWAQQRSELVQLITALN